MEKAVKSVKNYIKHLVVYFISFLINYIIFVILMWAFDFDKLIGIQIVNFIAWIVSMLFIFYVDKVFVPDLLDETNSKELFKFILIRILSLIIEIMVLYIFVSILMFNFYITKLISLILLFFFNRFYVKHVKFQ